MMQDTDDRYSKLASQVSTLFSIAQSDRRIYEQRCVSNHLQYRGRYEHSIKLVEGRSRVYPRDTRIKVEGFVAKMMELMFPASENNFTFQASPVPDIPPDDLNRLVQQFAQSTGQQPTPEQIRTLVYKFAEERAANMTSECEDQLQELDWAQMCKLVLRSGAKYGLGIARGPDVVFKPRQYYITDPITGSVGTEKEDIPRPFFDVVSIWNAYPDLSARTWEDQQFFFEEVVLGRSALYALATRADFRSDIIREYLRTNVNGNYTSPSYESLIRDTESSSSRESYTTPKSRQYLLRRMDGFVRAKYLRNLPNMSGLPAEDEEDVFVEVWSLDNFIIKAVRPPLGEKPSDLYHAFVYLGDEESPIWGTGMPENLRDSQMQLCASSRALMDNTASIAGPIVEVNESLLAPGEGKKQVRAFTTFRRDEMGTDAAIPAVRNIAVDSHINELLAVIRYQREVLDSESMLPSWLMGQTQQLGEAFRTSNNMSMMQGGANLFAKDVVRAFDKYIKSLIESLYNWNMKFNDKPDIKGDYDVIPRGSISLLAREVRGMALDQLFTTLTPEERALINIREALLERIKARDLPVSIVKDEQQADNIQGQQQQIAAQQNELEQQVQAAKIKQAAASADKLNAEAMAIGMTAPVKARTMATDSTANAIGVIGGALHGANSEGA